MADVATLGIKVENGEVVKATASLEGMAVAGAKTEAATQRLSRRMALAEIAAREMDAEFGRTGRAMALLEIEARKMDAEFGQVQRAMALAEIEARKMDAAMTESAAAIERASRQSFRLKDGAHGLTSALQAVAGALAIREVIGLADAYTGLHARLSLVSTDAANLARVEADLFAVSQQTRTGLEANVSLYSALARSTKNLGLSQADLLQVTKTVAQSFVISGASASETNSAVRQLSQAFASGVLRGDEFNSIAENAPRLQQAVAASLHITIGELRTMAEQGKLTGGVLAKALLDQAREIEAEFDKMPVTVAGAMTRIHNAVLMAVGGMNTATGSTAALASGLSALADSVPTLVKGFNSLFGGLELMAVDASIAWMKLRREIAQTQMQSAALTFKIPGLKNFSWNASQKAQATRDEIDSVLPGLMKWREDEERRLTALAAPGALNAGGPASPPGPDKAALKAAEKEFQRVLKDRIAAQAAAAREAEKEYRHGVDEAIRGLHEIEAEEDRQNAYVMMQYNEQGKAAQKAYQDELDAAARAFKEEDKYRDDMNREWRRGLQHVLSDGLRSWSGFFDSVFSLFTNLMRRMEAAGKDSGLLYGLLGLGSAAVGGGAAGFGIGSQIYSSSHGGFGNTARGALGGAAAGALAGSAIAPGIGTAVGAMAGLVGGIIGIGNASKEAAKAMAEAVKQVTLSMDALRAQVKGDTLGQAIAAVEADRAARAKQIEEAWSGGDANSDRVRWRTQQHKELNALEDERIRQLQEEYALSRQRAYEDLRVRDLASQGRTKEAEALQLQLAQQREMDQYIKDKADPATIALLQQVQAQEALAASTDRASAAARNSAAAMLNLESSYKVTSRIFEAIDAAGSRGGSSVPLPISTPRPLSPSGRTDPSGGQMAQPVVLKINQRVLGEAVVEALGGRASGPPNTGFIELVAKVQAQ